MLSKEITININEADIIPDNICTLKRDKQGEYYIEIAVCSKKYYINDIAQEDSSEKLKSLVYKLKELINLGYQELPIYIDMNFEVWVKSSVLSEDN